MYAMHVILAPDVQNYKADPYRCANKRIIYHQTRAEIGTGRSLGVAAGAAVAAALWQMVSENNNELQKFTRTSPSV